MIIFLIAILLISITFHEYAHGWVAHKLGDPTPKQSGRLTLNPLAHIDYFGTIALPIILLILSKGTFAIGYAKPVPINPYHFKNPKKDIRWVGIAGPSANILIAIILTFFLKLNIYLLTEVLALGIVINLILAIFNLIPVPPLDGSKVLASFLPNKIAYKYLKLETYGFVFITFLVMSGFVKWFILPIVRTIFHYLLKVNILI